MKYMLLIYNEAGGLSGNGSAMLKPAPRRIGPPDAANERRLVLTREHS